MKSFVGNVSYRPSLEQIAWVYDDGKGYLTAIDGHRLIEYEHETHIGKTILISPDAPLQFETDIYIQFLQGFIIYHTDDQVIYQNIVNYNNYPNYKKIIKTLKGDYKFIKVNKNDLIFSLQSALSFAGGKNTAGIALSFNGEYMDLRSFNIESSTPDVFTDKIKIIAGDATEPFNFTTNYLFAAVRASDEEEIELCFGDNHHLFIKEPGKMIVVMPIGK